MSDVWNVAISDIWSFAISDVWNVWCRSRCDIWCSERWYVTWDVWFLTVDKSHILKVTMSHIRNIATIFYTMYTVTCNGYHIILYINAFIFIIQTNYKNSYFVTYSHLKGKYNLSKSMCTETYTWSREMYTSIGPMWNDCFANTHTSLQKEPERIARELSFNLKVICRISP